MDALVKAYRSVDWLERLAVARNLNTPQRLVDGLKKDANRLVAQQAAETEALQHELQQWPALAIRIHDRWKSTLVGIVAGMTEWDGLDGETADCLKRVRHHREALSPLLSNTHAQAALIGRVVGEIILRSRDQELVPAFWNDPVWIQQFDVADFWSLMLPVDIADVAVLRRLEAMLEASEWQHLWTHLAGLQRVEIKVRVARHPLCPDYILRTLSKEQSAEVRAAVAQNPKADEVGTEQEPTHRPNGAGERSRRQVASDPLTLPKVLEQLLLSSDESPLDRGERMAVARNPSTPPHVLEKLSKDLDVFVRAEVASNPNSSISVIESLAKNPDRWIERALLKNPKTPPNLLASLATDFWSDTRCAVAAHPSTPATVLDDLSKDSNSKVRAEAARAANLSVGAIAVLALDRDKTVRLHVACRSDLAPDTLAELARDNSVAVREAVASHPLAPPATVQSLLRSLAIDSQPHVRANAARHPSVSESLLAVLANDDDRGVRLAVAQRRYLSELRRTDEGSPVFTFAAAIKMALLRERGEGSSNARSPHPWSAEDILYGCYALQLVPRQPTARFMNKAVRSKDWLTRLAMALHPHATRTHLKLLGEDDVADVVAAVNSRATQREHR